MQIKKLTPNLIVRNVEASLKFYREVLGLETGMTVPEQAPYVFGSVTNGVVEIFFNDQKTVAAEYPQLAATVGASLTRISRSTACRRCWRACRKRELRSPCRWPSSSTA